MPYKFERDGPTAFPKAHVAERRGNLGGSMSLSLSLRRRADFGAGIIVDIDRGVGEFCFDKRKFVFALVGQRRCKAVGLHLETAAEKPFDVPRAE
mmetsp:Transcript_22844/g.71605  ORF Transcript_22844/g.71605 Transcript_22844/m.71605 type:complete len:95 (+) Transcript_22844:227-511(+)